MTRFEEITNLFKEIQDSICEGLEKLDGKEIFTEDSWKRPEGGGGRSRVLSNGSLIEKGGVNFSEVHGDMPEKIAKSLGLPSSLFRATGVSIVLHPSNPWMPIIHMNVRYFEAQDQANPNESTYWFGGGIDLTPHYVVPEDARFFHQKLKQVCDQTDPHYYPRFKKSADDYFYLKHRRETRGIGGIFYDRLNEKTEQKEFGTLWQFHQNVANAFCPIYEHYANKYRNQPYDRTHKDWQMLRRGRYVEFNLVWDKGTKFGLDTNGRTESILMSLPPQANWEYSHQPADDSLEAKTLNWLKKDIDWIQYA